ncbi:MAG TPA: lipase family protein [Bacteroidia bacterium]|jgi:hypothetical protein|nr:lipase family protein [Bacteroidia bacterium]
MDALIYGNLVNIAYIMFSKSTTDITNTDLDPSTNSSISQLWPGGWRLITSITLQKTATTPDYITQNELFGFVAVNDSTYTAAIILRGTQTIMDWIIDVGVIPEADHDLGGTVESGFNEAYKALITDSGASLADYVKTLTQANIVVSGHSLGSSLATLTAADLAAAGKTNVTVYLFASPKTGSPDFVNNFHLKVQACSSFINIHDVVPMLPPGPFFGHVGVITSLDSSKFSAIKPSVDCWHTLLDYLYMLDQTDFSPPPNCKAVSA